jgi:hypothetical protein
MTLLPQSSPSHSSSPEAAPAADIATTPKVSSCCAPKEQERCCDASAKAGCCGATSNAGGAPSTCGCR